MTWLVITACKEEPGADIGLLDQVMKSVMPLISPAAGHLSHIISVGSSFASGDLIGTLELQDPDAVPTLEPFTGGFPQLSEPSTQAADPYEEFQDAMKAAEMVMTGTPPPLLGLFPFTWHLMH